ncbi:hypothetical protein UZ36_06475 [Candidatus Nitromaritima sp. SCGC AAA799-C22]|nr:hypothetical protein UZ36_06475 [Candidatus Nitromaritima sp. SCGC AAA799-C22]
MIMAGCVVALVLTGGGLYFGWKTFAPEELLQMGKTDTEIPDELTPKPEEGTDIEEPEPVEPPSLDESKEPEPEKAGAEEEKAPKERRRTGVAGGEEDKESDLAKELAQSDTLKESLAGEGDQEGLLAALSPEETQVTLSTIMPVAFDATDIRVLSFNLLIETSDRPSAQLIREALPIYEQVMVATIESFLKNKFYNDILYVKEKLQRRLQNNFNQKIEGDGRVKKVKFKDFLIQ